MGGVAKGRTGNRRFGAAPRPYPAPVGLGKGSGRGPVRVAPVISYECYAISCRDTLTFWDCLSIGGSPHRNWADPREDRSALRARFLPDYYRESADIGHPAVDPDVSFDFRPSGARGRPRKPRERVRFQNQRRLHNKSAPETASKTNSWAPCDFGCRPKEINDKY